MMALVKRYIAPVHDCFTCSNLIGPQHEQVSITIQDGVSVNHALQGGFCQKSSAEILNVQNRTVFEVCPCVRPIKTSAAFGNNLPAQRIPIVPRFRAVGNYEALDILKQTTAAPEAALFISGDLPVCFPDGRAPTF